MPNFNMADISLNPSSPRNDSPRQGNRFKYSNGTRILVSILGLLSISLSELGAQVVISEILASNKSFDLDNYGKASDWLELHNLSAFPVDLWEWTLSDDLERLDKWWIPNLAILPGESIRIWCSGRNQRNPKGTLHTNFKLSAKGETIYLTALEETIPTHVFDYKDHPQYPDISFGLDGSESTLRVLETDAKGRYFLPLANLEPEDWHQPVFDDSHWPQGKAPFGANNNPVPKTAWEIRTDLSMLVPEGASKAYFRFPFSYTEPPNHLKPQLSLRFNQGVVAYLNGERIARKGILKGSTWDPDTKRFIAEGTAGSFQNLQFDNITEKLRVGSNLLALEVMFREGKSIDFHISPSLGLISKESPGTGRKGYLESPSPDQINTRSYTKMAPLPQLSEGSGFFHQELNLKLSLPPGEKGEIHYTLDGSLPDLNSKKYQYPINLTSSTKVQARCFQEGSHASPTVAETYCPMQSAAWRFDSNLPVVLIDTQDGKIESDDYRSMAIEIFEPGSDGRTRLSSPPNYSGKGGIKLRGSSSLNRPKKGYRIELRDDQKEENPTSLLGMPRDADWILYGPYSNNKTLLNNVLVYEMSRRMGHYAPRTRFVEAFVNSEKEPLSMTSYVGLYVLMERIEISPQRVDIENPGSGGEALSGGYLFKIDRRGPGEQGFRAGMQDLAYVDPSEEDVTPAQTEWLTHYLDEFFNTLAGPNFSDPVNGYAAYIDVENWIDQRIIQEITRNPDAYNLSTYFTKPRGKKLRRGPVWDFDRAFYFGVDQMERGYYERWMEWSEEFGYNWGKLLMDDPSFRSRFRARGLELLNGVWSVPSLNALIDKISNEIEEAQARNHRRWGHLTPTEWRTMINYLKRYVPLRLDWLRGKFLPPPEVLKMTDTSKSKCTIELKTDQPNAKIYYSIGADPITDKRQLTQNSRRYNAPIQIKESETLAAVIEVEGQWSDPTHCTCLPPGRTLAVTEIMYHPQNPQLEFIEFQNLGDRSISLEGLTVSDSVDFEFSEGELKSLDPGEVLLIVRNLEAFKSIHINSAKRISGRFEDSLSDTSGRILVHGPNMEKIVDVFYSDTWYPETDLFGHSLTLAHPTKTPKKQFRDPRRWRPSSHPGGTPGTVETSKSFQN
jgi:hypothetical protein